MTIQVIFNSAQSIELDRRKIVGQTVSRSERIRTAERASANAFKFVIEPVSRFRYSLVRGVLESIMTPDRHTEQTVNIATTPGLWYLTQYLGDCSSAQLGTMSISAFTNTSVTLNNLPSIGSSLKLFRAGDWIQPTWSRYPYIVTSDVNRGSGSLATATVHRSLITSEATTVTGAFYVGTATSLKVVVTELPTYKLIQRDWAEFTGQFTVVESII